MADATVGFTSKTTLSLNFAAHLAAAGRTISSATVTASAGAITNVTPTTTAVLFRFDATSITGPDPVLVTITTTPTYDNGDIDPRVKTIQVTAAT